ncbi:MAG: TorD/DmsD family molecular chaperone, partial [Caldilineaceae bacterium]
MPLTQIALARSRGYALLADVAARGLTPESLAPLRAVRDLAPVLPEALDGPGQDKAAAEHYTVFGLNVFAYESVFLDPEARMGGAVAARAQESCARLGFAASAGQEPDGLVAQLGCLAFLCGAEAEAREDHKVGAADRIRRKQAEFLGNHLLCWLPALSEALARQESRFYAALAPLITSLCIDHYADIAPLRAPESLAAA